MEKQDSSFLFPLFHLDNPLVWKPLRQETDHHQNNGFKVHPSVKPEALSDVKVQLSCRAGPLQACGGRRRARRGRDWSGPAGLLGYRPPTESLAEWASSMERLIPARTKSPPVVLLELQAEELRVSAAVFYYKYQILPLIL